MKHFPFMCRTNPIGIGRGDKRRLTLRIYEWRKNRFETIDKGCKSLRKDEIYKG